MYIKRIRPITGENAKQQKITTGHRWHWIQMDNQVKQCSNIFIVLNHQTRSLYKSPNTKDVSKLLKKIQPKATLLHKFTKRTTIHKGFYSTLPLQYKYPLLPLHQASYTSRIPPRNHTGNRVQIVTKHPTNK